jgi:trans-aconitate methyltransferase
MKRILEPSELMLMEDQCNEYFNANRIRMRKFFIQQLVNTIEVSGTIADLGCGPCDYDVCISKIFPTITIDAYDGSAAMIALAKKNTILFPNINVLHKTIETIDKKYDVIISANTLHHFSNPAVFWKSVKSMSTGCTNIFIMDLLRPNSISELDNIINSSSIELTKLFKKDFKDSLQAAFTEQEIKEQLLNYDLHLSTITYAGELDIIIIYGSI